MLSKLTKVTSFTAMSTAVGAAVLFFAAATPAEARDWRSSMDRHYEAAEATRFVPKAATPEWGFSLDEVVADMEWRQRTAEILRGAPRPNSEPNDSGRGQLADRPETSRPRFSF
jgi:hypothetical protein